MDSPHPDTYHRSTTYVASMMSDLASISPPLFPQPLPGPGLFPLSIRKCLDRYNYWDIVYIPWSDQGEASRVSLRISEISWLNLSSQ